MKKLELKHLAAYLPYKVEVKRFGFVNETFYLTVNNISHVLENKDYLKLRKLSDLTKEIEINGEKFVPSEILFPKSDYKNETDRLIDIQAIILQNAIYHSCTYFAIVQKLLEWHFDCFGLIDAGLAISINTL